MTVTETFWSNLATYNRVIRKDGVFSFQDLL